jgi:hypothetical protein
VTILLKSSASRSLFLAGLVHVCSRTTRRSLLVHLTALCTARSCALSTSCPAHHCGCSSVHVAFLRICVPPELGINTANTCLVAQHRVLMLRRLFNTRELHVDALWQTAVICGRCRMCWECWCVYSSLYYRIAAPTLHQPCL